MTAPPPLLALDGFGLAYGGRRILDAVSAEVHGPGCTVLLGPSGTGKSSLLRTLAGFNQANPSLQIWGRARYRGRPCGPDNQPAMVQQHSKLLVSNVLENLVCSLPDRADLTQRMQIEQISQTLEDTGLPHLLDCLPQKVVERSITDQRLIAILRQWLSGAELLMIDEPTADLNEDEAEPILALIQRLAARRALLVVLHHLMQAQRVADRVILLANGRVEEAGAAAEFFHAPRSDNARRFLATGSCPEMARDTGIQDDGADVEDRPADIPAPGAPAANPLAPDSPAPGAPVAATPPGIAPPRSSPAPVGAVCGPRGFLWLLPGRLAGTPWPGVVRDTDDDLTALRDVGITRLVSLTEKPFDPDLAARYGMHCHASPMPDMHPPSRQQALDLCAAIDAFIAAGEAVAVHCHAGLGRTGTILAAYWLWLARGRLSALQALEDIRRIEPLWVQSQAQVDFLEEFAQVVAALPGNPADTAARRGPSMERSPQPGHPSMPDDMKGVGT